MRWPASKRQAVGPSWMRSSTTSPGESSSSASRELRWRTHQPGEEVRVRRRGADEEHGLRVAGDLHRLGQGFGAVAEDVAANLQPAGAAEPRIAAAAEPVLPGRRFPRRPGVGGAPPAPPAGHHEVAHRRLAVDAVVDPLQPAVEPADDQVRQVEPGLRSEVEAGHGAAAEAGVVPGAGHQLRLGPRPLAAAPALHELQVPHGSRCSGRTSR